MADLAVTVTHTPPQFVGDVLEHDDHVLLLRGLAGEGISSDPAKLVAGVGAAKAYENVEGS